MKIKTSELIGPALDWVVLVLCEGNRPDEVLVMGKGAMYVYSRWNGLLWSPSHDWQVGGPIIEREKFTLDWLPRPQEWYAERKQHSTDGFVTHMALCSTPLIAAMRCYVASKLGDEVEVPEELSR